jgi:hypothetical protein
MWHGVPEFLGFVAIVASLVHLAIRRWIVACAFWAMFCSVANLAHEAWLVNFKVNLGRAPVELIAGCMRSGIQPDNRSE